MLGCAYKGTPHLSLSQIVLGPPCLTIVVNEPPTSVGEPGVDYELTSPGCRASVREVQDTIVVRAEPLGSIEAFDHSLREHVLPRTVHARGRLCLHGSAIARGGRAIAIVGRSGAGKSTLAASLIERGFALVADDTVLAFNESGRWQLLGTAVRTRHRETGLHLLQCSEAAVRCGERWVVSQRPMDGSAQLVAVALVAPDADQCLMEPLRAREALDLSVAVAKRPPIFSPKRLLDEFGLLQGLAASVPHFRLGLPHDSNGLATAVDALERLL